MVASKELLKYTQDMTLLFVEDHDELRMNNVEILKNFFKTVKSAKNGVEALEIYKEEKLLTSNYFDLVLTDIQMPKMNGVDMIEKIYDIRKEQLVVVLSAYDDAKYLLPLINLGIEQFIKKPINFQELLKVLIEVSKKRLIAKISDTNKTEVMLNEDFIYNLTTNTLLKNGKNVYLTKYELIFLQQLLQKPGKIYSNEDIVSHFSSLEEELNVQNIRKLVSKLRKKLPNDCLESIYGIGYKIISLN